ncbi:MAG: hypothetical protein IRZ01_05900 [Thermoflavifilum aggregans]|nr:hypothetical protein [Thermoflavifilum aggregans]
MKRIPNIICRWMVCMLPLLASCGPSTTSSEPGQSSADTTSPGFASPQDAAQQGKHDLLEILRMHPPDFYGISDTALLEKSAPAAPVNHYVLDFNRLLQADSVSNLMEFPKEEANAIVPLVADGQIVTVIELSHQNDQWKVAALAGKAITDDLQVVYQVVPRFSRDPQAAQIALMEVPNLQAKLFVLRVNQAELVFTNYKGFSLREPVAVPTVMSVLHRDALQFQREYGDQLKKQRLTE